MNNEQKIVRARHILRLRQINHALGRLHQWLNYFKCFIFFLYISVNLFLGTEFINADEKENKEDEEEDYSVSQPVAPDAGLTELNITAEEPPYFKSNDNIVLFNETHALPAGRTLKLNCRAKGYPEPQVRFMKNLKFFT